MLLCSRGGWPKLEMNDDGRIHKNPPLSVFRVPHHSSQQLHAAALWLAQPRKKQAPSAPCGGLARDALAYVRDGPVARTPLTYPVPPALHVDGGEARPCWFLSGRSHVPHLWGRQASRLARAVCGRRDIIPSISLSS